MCLFFGHRARPRLTNDHAARSTPRTVHCSALRQREEVSMANGDKAEKFGDLVRGFLNGGVGRRQFIGRGTQLGLSAGGLAKLAGPARAAMMDSAPEAPYES